MASPETITRAIKLTRENQGDVGKRGSRIHEPAAQTRAAVLRALEHPCCATCDYLDIDYRNSGNREIVVLRCNAYHSPVGLWEDLWLEETATCLDCTDPAGRPPKKEL